jgi:UDP-glucose 4-epimerase
VLITGGAGFIGSHLAELLRSRGRRVLIIDDLSTGREANMAHLVGDGCRFVRGRVGDVLRERPELMQGVTHVFHLAASVGVQLVVSDPARIIRNNVEETSAVIDAAARVGAGVLVASSSEVYGKSEAVPLREDGDLIYGPTTGPRWSYAMSKAVDEHLALSYHAGGAGSAVVVRLFNTIGPRQVGHYGMVVPRFVEAAVKGQDLTIYGDGQQTRAFCDVRDVVKAMAALMEDAGSHGQVFNIGSDVEVTIESLADKVIAMTGGRSRKRLVSFDEAYRPGFEDPFRRRVPDTTKIRAAIGWKPAISLEATLKELIDAARFS